MPDLNALSWSPPNPTMIVIVAPVFLLAPSPPLVLELLARQPDNVSAAVARAATTAVRLRLPKGMCGLPRLAGVPCVPDSIDCTTATRHREWARRQRLCHAANSGQTARPPAPVGTGGRALLL